MALQPHEILGIWQAIRRDSRIADEPNEVIARAAALMELPSGRVIEALREILGELIVELPADVVDGVLPGAMGERFRRLGERAEGLEISPRRA